MIKGWILAVCLSVYCESAYPESLEWHHKSWVGMEVGPTGAQFGSDHTDVGYAAHFDGREIVRRARAAHSQYLVLWCRDGEYAYYDSKLLPKCPGLGNRDPLREAVEEARPHAFPIIAYCVVQQGGAYLREHSEFAMRDQAGNLIERFCLNSGYLEVMKKLSDEMLAYDIQGFHIDMIDQGFGPPYGCWCPTCKTAYEKEYGHPMPNGVTWDEAWFQMLQFRYQSSERFERALCSHIKDKNSSVTVDFNYHGNPPFSWEVGQRPVQHAVTGDFVTGETGVWGFSALTVGLNARFYAAATPGRRPQVAIQRGVRMYHDQTTRPLNDIRWELLTLLSHGAFVTMVDKTAYNGWLDPVAYERVGEAFEEALKKQDLFTGEIASEVGIYFSSRTRDAYGREEPGKYFQFFLGAHRAMVYEHIPWDVILDENATQERLKRFRVVLIPGAAVLSPEEIALFQEYAHSGGNLILTGFCGMMDSLGKWIENPPVSSLVGATAASKLDSMDNHIRFPSNATESTSLDHAMLHEGLREDWPFLVEGPAMVWKPTTASAIGELMKPHRTLRQRQGKEGTVWPMSADAPVGPAILLNSIGQGKVLTFAASPDAATAGEHPISEARHLLRNAVRFLNPNPRIRIEAPLNVEAVVTEDTKKRIFRIHLIGYTAPPATMPLKDRPFVMPSLIENAPSYEITIELDGAVRKVRTCNSSTEIRKHGKIVRARVNDIHETLTVEYR